MEYYLIEIPPDTDSKFDIFRIYTETCYLGESNIKKWDSFEDLLYSRIASSDILIHIHNHKLLNLNIDDKNIYFSILNNIVDEFPDKIKIDLS